MSTEKEIINDGTEMNSVKHVYILETIYCIGGGVLLYCRIIEYLMKYTDIKIKL